jgi:hypothetical protein
MGMPCCCLELINGVIYAVGNGYVTAPTTVDMGDCGIGTVLINDLPPPVFVHDCEIITIKIVTQILTIDAGSCPCICECCLIDLQCSPCLLPMAMAKPLWKRKVDARTGKVKLNPNTGKPIIVLNKNELLKRIKNRIEKSKRRSKK